MDFLICASTQYLEARDTPNCAEDFQKHQRIGFRIEEKQQLQPIFLTDNKDEYLRCELARSHITDDGEAMAYICANGLGFAQLPHFPRQSGLGQRFPLSLLQASTTR